MLTPHQSKTDGTFWGVEDAGDCSCSFAVGAQGVAHRRHVVADPSPELLLGSAEVGELGHGFLAEKTPLAQAYEIRQSQL